MLSEAQARAYDEQGYLLASGLIPDPIATEAEASMWRLLDARPDEPSAWAYVPPGHRVYDEPALVACYTPALLEAAARLAEDDPATIRAPTRAYAINLFPKPGEWQWPKPHIDHAIKEAGHHVFPRAFRVASMVYLSDVPPHGGGTVVWPGSHRQLEALARSDPERFDLMWALNQEVGRIELNSPVELTPRRGDVLFYHYLCAHAGSANTSNRVRLAMNAKW